MAGLTEPNTAQIEASIVRRTTLPVQRMWVSFIQARGRLALRPQATRKELEPISELRAGWTTARKANGPPRSPSQRTAGKPKNGSATALKPSTKPITINTTPLIARYRYLHFHACCLTSALRISCPHSSWRGLHASLAGLIPVVFLGMVVTVNQVLEMTFELQLVHELASAIPGPAFRQTPHPSRRGNICIRADGKPPRLLWLPDQALLGPRPLPL